MTDREIQEYLDYELAYIKKGDGQYASEVLDEQIVIRECTIEDIENDYQMNHLTMREQIQLDMFTKQVK